MTLSLILPMAAFALAASISPGPVNLMCLSSGTRYPLSWGLIFVTGAPLGIIALFVTIGLGLYSVLAGGARTNLIHLSGSLFWQQLPWIAPISLGT